MPETLAPHQLSEFLSGYQAAQRGEPLDQHGTFYWLDGFKFRLEVMLERFGLHG